MSNGNHHDNHHGDPHADYQALIARIRESIARAGDALRDSPDPDQSLRTRLADLGFPPDEIEYACKLYWLFTTRAPDDAYDNREALDLAITLAAIGEGVRYRDLSS